MIKVKNLSKTFMVQKRREGFSGVVKDFFHRQYEEKEAVKNVSFSIEQGEIVGYLGPNGAGKSTTMKMLSGILVPSGGSVNVLGYEPYKDRVKNAKNIGAVFGQRSQLWWDIPVIDSLSLMKYMYKIPDSVFAKNMDMFKELLEMNDFINTPVRQLSLGQRMRADFACALLHNPPILYLDEPTIGLDVVVKENIRELITTINKEMNTTIMLTTHDMSDIEKLCSRVIVIDNGTKMFDGSIDEVKEKYGNDCRIVIQTSDTDIDLNVLKMKGITSAEVRNGNIDIWYERKEISAANILNILVNNDISLKDFKIYEDDIDQIVRQMYNDLPK
ncbi:MAG: ATP-binding cassette domain-containing protein [Lachnospiraceae bacterium]|nr:ATP-binding cassette domain-containing protein [Lachnospiraceae bacterium]